ncbi:LysR substrate-binding domain-containing protein [Pseudomonas aeruginosa]|uniref:LysR substrate-binding domain-containing protein n=1 Tax=Pseudomonas aeruginosa TaxID=287 RepID=UPI0029359653|nr:LysR substrate-binding domain-containing protein [Pseudomonas aeruginosa]MDV2791142.1 LysR substrate-binding domain-containing protein [Pseudomonas aeruginosa]
MHDINIHPPRLRVAIAPGVPSLQLSALLALQRAEDPDTALTLFEVAGDDLLEGLLEGRYDVGVSLSEASSPAFKTQPLWIENMAVAIPLQFPLLDQAALTISDLHDCSVFRWQAEACPLLDHRLSSLLPVDQQNLQTVTSFEMMALRVAAGYGIGVSAQSRIEYAHGREIDMRPLSDGPYEIVTHLLRPNGQVSPAIDRFERRAQQVAKAGST